jgi:hypothetical protein
MNESTSSNQVNNQVNQQIIDAVASTNYGVLSQASNESMGIAYESMAQAIAMVMQNASATQFGAKNISTTSVAVTCKKILDIS